MTSPLRLLITVAILCHLLLGAKLVTSQLPPAQSPGNPASLSHSGPSGAFFAPVNEVCLAALPLISGATQDLPAQSGGVTRESVTPAGTPVEISSATAEKAGDMDHLRGDVIIHYRNYVLRADDVTYNEASGQAEATGHVRLEGGPGIEQIEASSASYNIQSETGTFRNVIATLGMANRNGHMVLTSPNPLAFTGDTVQRASPERFVAHHAVVTTCDLRRPAWKFQAERAVIDIGVQADLYHTTFRLQGVPLLYLPYVQRPVENLGRQSGFLLPTIGQSSTKGVTLGDSFYWVINRSMDATLGGEYFSRRGWAQNGEFRFRPEADSFFDLVYSGVLDRGAPIGSQVVKEGGEEVRATGDDTGLPWGLRGVADLDYLSSFLYRLAFSENFTQAVNSEVKSTAFVSRNSDGYGFNVVGSRYQNFESTNPGDLVTILHAPSVESSASERQVGDSRVFWSYEAAAEGVSRHEPGFLTSALVGRLDLQPSVAAPIVAAGWSFRPELALRDTYYTERVIPNAGLGVPETDPINRRALQLGFEVLPPALSRTFEHTLAGRKLKHVIEPRLQYQYVNGVDNFQNIIRFDTRDLLSDTDELEYAIVNRLYGKRMRPAGDCSAAAATRSAGMAATLAPEENIFRPEQGALENVSPCEPAGSVREIVRWEVAQKAFFDPTFGGAVIDGRRNVLTTTADFTGIAFLTEPRNFSPIISRLRVETSARSDLQWNLDYDTKKGRISGSSVFATWRIGEFYVAANQTYFQVPGEIFATTPLALAEQFNQFRLLGGFGHPNKHGLSAAASVGYDAFFHTIQYGTIQSSYNWSCLGVSFEYRRFTLNSSQGAVRNENQFRFSLNLANIGTFGNLRRQERLF